LRSLVVGGGSFTPRDLVLVDFSNLGSHVVRRIESKRTLCGCGDEKARLSGSMANITQVRFQASLAVDA
jgi:hypothetical protein